MSTATTFRVALGAAAVCFIIAIAAFINHFASPVAHPAFGAKVGIFFLIVALACAVYANYNRPGVRR